VNDFDAYSNTSGRENQPFQAEPLGSPIKGLVRPSYRVDIMIKKFGKGAIFGLMTIFVMY